MLTDGHIARVGRPALVFANAKYENMRIPGRMNSYIHTFLHPNGMPPIDRERPPASLLERFTGDGAPAARPIKEMSLINKLMREYG